MLSRPLRISALAAGLVGLWFLGWIFLGAVVTTASMTLAGALGYVAYRLRRRSAFLEGT